MHESHRVGPHPTHAPGSALWIVLLDTADQRAAKYTQRFIDDRDEDIDVPIAAQGDRFAFEWRPGVIGK